MTEKPTFRSFWLPIILAVITLVILNLGLYTRLVSQPVQASEFAFPYQEDFSTLDQVTYEEFGGDWEIRDEQLVQLSTSGFDLSTFIPLELSVDSPYQYEASLRFLGGTMGGGLIFNAQQTTSRQKSHMVRFNVDSGQLWLIYGYFGDDSNFMGQGSVPLPFDPDNVDTHRLGVQVNADDYNLLLNGDVLAENVPLQYQGGAVGLISAASQVAFDDISIAPAAETITREAEAVPESAPVIEDPLSTLEFADTFENTSDGESLWLPISGTWEYEGGSLKQTEAGGFDFTAIYQEAVNFPLVYEATFAHEIGAGGGVVFGLPQATLRNNGYLVRYVEDGTVIAWGYYDETGRFNGLGSAEVPLAGTEEHLLQVIVTEDSFSVRLDGTELVNDVPLNQPLTSGYIGLTASQSVVAFNEVRISSVEKMPTAVETATISPGAVTGTWIQNADFIVQTDVELTDYIAGTGLAGEEFIISVDITVPETAPEAGGGLVFHMAGRDNPYPGYMVRTGSNEIFWGEYDEAGVFAGEGSVPFDIERGAAHTLQLVVRTDNYDIAVNDETLIETIPIDLQSGWIGLASFSGPVEFANVRLELGE